MHTLSANEKNRTNSPLIQTNIPLADKNWFQTGGAAQFYSEPRSTEQFQEAIMYSATHKLPLFILGQGANVLISDEGFNGLVIRPFLSRITTKYVDSTTTLVTADAGVTMPQLIDYCLDNNVLGLEEFSGIPGTVGGSVYINLHYFNFLLADFLVSAEIIDKKDGTLHTVDASWFKFGYNDSQLQKKDCFLVNATFALRNATATETAFAQGRKTEIIRHRAHRYPQLRTCGSFFRNFFTDEVSAEIEEKKITFVAYYLDKVGVKGSLRHGNAIVSHQHANMIVNLGSATSTDIIILAREMQKLVHNTFGIIPQPECQLIGFAAYPLLQQQPLRQQT